MVWILERMMYHRSQGIEKRKATTNINKCLVFSTELIIKGKLITQICCHFKTQKCLSVSGNEIIVKFVINYHPSATKLSISTSGQRQSKSERIET